MLNKDELNDLLSIIGLTLPLVFLHLVFSALSYICIVAFIDFFSVCTSVRMEIIIIIIAYAFNVW